MKAKKKIVIAAILFGSLAAIFSVIVVYVVFRGVLEDHGQIVARKHELLQLQEYEKGSREFEAFSKQHEEDLSRLEDLFVDSETPIALFRFLDDTADAFGLRMEKAPGSVQRAKEDRWSSFEVRLAGGGGYPDVMAFLQKIENGPYLLEVKTMSLLAGQESQGEVEFTATLKVFTK